MSVIGNLIPSGDSASLGHVLLGFTSFRPLVTVVLGIQMCCSGVLKSLNLANTRQAGHRQQEKKKLMEGCRSEEKNNSLCVMADIDSDGGCARGNVGRLGASWPHGSHRSGTKVEVGFASSCITQ